MDVDGFASMFRREHPRLVALGLALTGNRETAADLAQETLARAYRSWDRIERYEVPAAWLRRVLINLAVDVGRKQQREHAALARLEPGEAAGGMEGVGGEWWQRCGRCLFASGWRSPSTTWRTTPSGRSRR